MKTLCILGRQPEISIAELESLYGSGSVLVLNDEVALLDVHPDNNMQDRLGGTIKTGRLFTSVPEKSWKDLEHYLTMTLPSQLDNLPDRKIHLGISLYGMHVSLKDLQRTSFALKKVLKKAGKSIRIIPNKHLALSSAQVFHNHITDENGVELLIVKAKTGKIYIGQTISVQNIDAYTARDQKRPKRDTKVGMLPPKLAQIIINLAVGTLETNDRSQKTEDNQGLDVLQGKSEAQNGDGLDEAQGSSDERMRRTSSTSIERESVTDTAIRQERQRLASFARKQGDATVTILDPFCGTGVILQEALLMNYNAHGTDLEPRMIDYTQQNLDWLQYDDSLSTQLEVADATTHEWSPLPDVIAGEAYLGRPFTDLPDSTTLKKVVQDVDTIIKKFLKNVAEQTQPGFRLCIAVPAWKKHPSFTANQKNNDTTKTIRASSAHGAVEQRTEPYKKYGKGVAQTATQRSAASKSSVSSSARKQDFATDGFWHLPVLDHLEKLGYNRQSFVHVGREPLVYHREDQVVARELTVLVRN